MFYLISLVFRLKCWFKGQIISRIHLSLPNAYKLMCFDRNINGNRNVVFFEWDYWSLHWRKKFTLVILVFYEWCSREALVIFLKTLITTCLHSYIKNELSNGLTSNFVGWLKMIFVKVLFCCLFKWLKTD